MNRLAPMKDERIGYELTHYQPPLSLRIEDFHRHTSSFSTQVQVTANLLVALGSGLRLFLTVHRTNGKDDGFQHPMNGHFSAQVLAFECAEGRHQLKDCASCRTNHALNINTLKGEVSNNKISLNANAFTTFIENVYEEFNTLELITIDSLEGIVQSILEGEALEEIFSLVSRDELREVKGVVYRATLMGPPAPLREQVKDHWRIARLWMGWPAK